MSQPRIAFLGTGLMGGPMAANLLKAGFPVIAWNRTLAKAEALRPAGGTVAPSAAAAADGADAVITMLEGGPVVESVLFDGGVVAALKRGAVVIDTSSAEPQRARAHAERLAALGIGYLDAPVSGGTPGAKAGTLAIMAGGAEADFERAVPIFSAMGRATHVGPAGAGQLAKLCNQVIVSVTMVAVAEALLLAAAGGADPAAVRQALSGGFADSKILQIHGGHMLERSFIPGGPAWTIRKDGRNILAAAREFGVTLPMAERANGLFEQLCAHGGEKYDSAAVLLELERMSGKRLGTAPDRLPS
ncbi:MAG TPA: NAD(P)-dependent oxidoreductase [Stellaceae bacterium]|nr:NAD(P)-dependent oxidoreductase [Stellaceae bacterium]